MTDGTDLVKRLREALAAWDNSGHPIGSVESMRAENTLRSITNMRRVLDTVERLERELAERKDCENDYVARLDAMQFVINQAGFNQQRLREQATLAEHRLSDAMKRLEEIGEIARGPYFQAGDQSAFEGGARRLALQRIATIANEATEKENGR